MMTLFSSGYGIAMSALFICLTDLLYTVLDGHTKKPQNRVYISILLLLAVNAGCEMIHVRLEEAVAGSDRAFFIYSAAKFVYFLSHSLIPPLLFFYISFVVGRSVAILTPRKSGGTAPRIRMSVLTVVVIAVQELLILLNPLTHWCWYYSADRAFQRAWGEYVFIYVPSAVWVFAAFLLTMKSWNILSRGRKRSIAICFLLVCMGVVMQMICKDFRIEVLMEALGFTGALLFIENEDDRRNVELNAYNSAAFSLDVTAAINNLIPIKVLILRNIDFNNKANALVSVKTSRDAVSRAVSEYLGTVIKPYYIYAIGSGKFALVLYNYSDEKAAALAETVHKRFQTPWNIEGTDIVLSARVLLVPVPEIAKTIDEILYIAHCPIPENLPVLMTDKASLDRFIRRAAVENAVVNGLDNHSFEVYYQPTYHMNKSLHGAEALLRMHDETLGMIYPDEFIPIAEQLGIIDRLDEFVLKEVCAFIGTGIPKKSGMDCINVNLSVLECMKDGFAEYISGVVSGLGVQKDMINFEITESVAAKDYDRLADVIGRLKKEGFRFAIDDYGTGYSNITSVFSLGVDIIKLDKSLLWNAENSELGMTLLKASMDMVHKMKKKTLMEGVETEAHMRILKALGCEYLQGFYFSKPLPQTDFIELITRG